MERLKAWLAWTIIFAFIVLPMGVLLKFIVEPQNSFDDINGNTHDMQELTVSMKQTNELISDKVTLGYIYEYHRISATPTSTNTPTPTYTCTPTATPSPTVTPTLTVAPTHTPTAAPKDDRIPEGASYAGRFRLTAYCPCNYCNGQWAHKDSNGNWYCDTASGVRATEGRTIACNVLPLGTKVWINGYTFVVEDRFGGNDYSTKKIDVYIGSHSRALQYEMGCQYWDVYILTD